METPLLHHVHTPLLSHPYTAFPAMLLFLGTPPSRFGSSGRNGWSWLLTGIGLLWLAAYLALLAVVL